jgi:hypothetical protein
MEIANSIICWIIDELDEDDLNYPLTVQEAANTIGISYSIMMDSVMSANLIADWYCNCRSIGSSTCEGMQ